jgi:hypothetical protein
VHRVLCVTDRPSQTLKDTLQSCGAIARSGAEPNPSPEPDPDRVT